MTNHHKKTDVQHDVPPPGVAPNVSYGSRECEKQTLLTTMVVLWWCCGGAVAEHTTHQRGLESTLCFPRLQTRSFTLFLIRKVGQL